MVPPQVKTTITRTRLITSVGIGISDFDGQLVDSSAGIGGRVYLGTDEVVTEAIDMNPWLIVVRLAWYKCGEGWIFAENGGSKWQKRWERLTYASWIKTGPFTLNSRLWRSDLKLWKQTVDNIG
jgi:hypothetical protein